jgi:hypothetical protein
MWQNIFVSTEIKVPTDMPAHLEPQEAINRGLNKPSECDLVIVIFGARMGTPLSDKNRKPDGGRYLSGTEYEFLDGLNAAEKTGKPEVLVYRKSKAPSVPFDDPEYDEKKKQWYLVKVSFQNLEILMDRIRVTSKLTMSHQISRSCWTSISETS